VQQEEAGRIAVTIHLLYGEVEEEMRENDHNWGLRFALIMVLAIGLVFLGQVISMWWILITTGVSAAVWTIIWLWPEVPERVESEGINPTQRLAREQNRYPRGN
jgi:hypothetical protein